MGFIVISMGVLIMAEIAWSAGNKVRSYVYSAVAIGGSIAGALFSGS